MKSTMNVTRPSQPTALAMACSRYRAWPASTLRPAAPAAKMGICMAKSRK